VNLRTAGRRACRARHKSYCGCIFIHSSGVVPRAGASRMAMAAEIPALPLSPRESVTRVVRRWAAAVVHGQFAQIFAQNLTGVGWIMHAHRSSSPGSGAVLGAVRRNLIKPAPVAFPARFLKKSAAVSTTPTFCATAEAIH